MKSQINIYGIYICIKLCHKAVNFMFSMPWITKYNDRAAGSVFASDYCSMVTDLLPKALKSLAVLFLSCNFMNILSQSYNSAIRTQNQCTVEKKLNYFKDQNLMLDDGNNIKDICLRTGHQL